MRPLCLINDFLVAGEAGHSVCRVAEQGNTADERAGDRTRVLEVPPVVVDLGSFCVGHCEYIKDILLVESYSRPTH